jgi:hypothetical protein
MDFLGILFHLCGFASPALALGLVLPLSARWLRASAPIVTGFWKQAAIVTGAGLMVLVGGLWFFSQDGKTATYGVLVLVASLVQGALVRVWRR